MISPSAALLCTVVVLAPFTGCSRDNAARALPEHGRFTDSSGGNVVSLGIGRTPYHAIAAAATGALTGRITVGGGATAEAEGSAVRGDSACSDSGDAPPRATAGGVVNVLVWIEGMTSGKPLPELRRETLTIDHCSVEPRVLAVVSPTTINVFSRDKDTHQTFFYREAGAAVDSVRTVDEGEVVPSERVASIPGIVEIRDPKHPSVRGYIAAFNHPYFAVTDATGAFKIDGLQPGTYTIKVWQEQLSAPVEQRVVIGPGGNGHVDVQLALP